MSHERTNPFLSFDEPPEFKPKLRPEKRVPNEVVGQMADENGFPSRQAVKQSREPKRKPHHYRTGRDRQLNIKATSHTVERLHKMSAERKLPLGAVLELALDALDARQQSPPTK